MPEFLRVTTPLVNKNQAAMPKPGIDPTGAFSIQNTTKVIQTHNQSELLKQNNGMPENGEAPNLLLDLLKDPTVTASYLKNIFMLEELFKLLPANNNTVSKEIESIFESLLIKPEQLVEEMQRQEQESTAFKGELFDFLRYVSEKEHDRPEVQQSIARLLRSINSMGNHKDILESITNNLCFLREKLGASKAISERLDRLIAGFRAENAGEEFQSLKSETIGLIKEIEDSILFTSKISKVLSILTYNLSRYNSNTDFAAESAYRFRQLLSQEDKKVFNELFEKFVGRLRGSEGLNYIKNTPDGFDFINPEPRTDDGSDVMSMLIKLISRQTQSEQLSATDTAKIEKMLHSLLSSPCSFTPLLHFILPLVQDDMRAFAEVWINPECDERDLPQGAEKGLHLLMVIDIDGVGRFETEFLVYNNTIDFSLYCPKGYEQGFDSVVRALPRIVYGTGYHMGSSSVSPLDNERSLMEVFKSLPYRRVGVDVKI